MSSDVATLVRTLPAAFVQHKPYAAVERGPLSTLYQNTAASTGSSAQITFQAFSPMPEAMLDRYMTVGATFQFTFQCTTPNPGVAGAPLVLPGRDFAMVDWVLAHLTTSANVSINSSKFTLDMSNGVTDALLAITQSRANRALATTPTALPRYLDHNDAFATNANVLAGFEGMVDGSTVPNGAFDVRFVNPTNGTLLTGAGNYNVGGVVTTFANGIPTKTAGQAVDNISVQVQIVEPILVSPFVTRSEKWQELGAFTHVQNYALDLSLQSPSLARVIQWNSAASGATIANVIWGFNSVSGCNLRALWLTAPPSVKAGMDPINVVPYAEYVKTTTVGAAAVAPLATTTVILQTQSLVQVPDYFIIVAQPDTYATSEANWFLAPADAAPVRVQFGARSGLLSEWNLPEIYDMTRKYLPDVPIEQFRGRAVSVGGALVATRGAPIVIPTSYLELDDSLAPGSLTNTTCQIQLQLFNQSGRTVTPVVTCLAVYSGWCVTGPGNMTRQQRLGLTERDVLETTREAPYAAVDMERMVGGAGFMSKLSTFASRARDLASKAVPMARSVCEKIEKYAPMLERKEGSGRRRSRSPHRARGGAGRSRSPDSPRRYRKLADRLM